jgi:predicted dehydrogenase
MKAAIVGCGSRHKMFRDAIMTTHAEGNEVVAVCDTNEHRLRMAAAAASKPGTNGVASYLADDFDAMLAEQKPQTVIVTTPDYTHSDYIVRALDAGCDVISEKPLTTDLPKLKLILDAQRRSGKQIQVTFNYRYAPARTQLKAMLDAGAIGEVTAVTFKWYLDRVHGADYFRRWHRQKANSGGLLVHKSTHHFDLLNWWLGARPAQVFATGTRRFYRPETAVELGLQERGARCSTCPVAAKCDFDLKMQEDLALSELYGEAEHLDGYFRDLCVFDEEIGIEDTMQAAIRYENGVTTNYTLIAYSPWEGFEVTFHGTKGDLLHRHVEVHGVFGGARKHASKDAITTTLHLAGQEVQQIKVEQGEGDHGGADPVMLGYIFAPETMPEDAYARRSDHVAGGWSILTGIAANLSIARGVAVDIQEMLAAEGISL